MVDHSSFSRSGGSWHPTTLPLLPQYVNISDVPFSVLCPLFRPEAYQKGQATLTTSPQDPAANLAAGRYLCLFRGQWHQGLTALASSSDDALKALAQQELKRPAGADQQVALADAWWELADKEEGYPQSQLQAHAGQWYRQALPQLTGLMKEKVEKRLPGATDAEKSLTLAGFVLKPAQASPPPPAVAPFDAGKAKQHQEGWAKHLGVPVEMTNSIGMKFVLIPPGEFDMGATPEEIAWAADSATKDRDVSLANRVRDEGPVHRVKISQPFYLATFPVTQDEYEKVMNVNPSDFAGKPMDVSRFSPLLQPKEMEFRDKAAMRMAGKDTSRHPVEMVSWMDATEFCRKLSALPEERSSRSAYRLPTEAQWEYACRAGSTSRWYSGDDPTRLNDIAWYGDTSRGTTCPVGQKHPNAWGLHDMQRNVLQWCADWFGQDYYQQSPSVDPLGPLEGSRRVLRGCSWNADSPWCRSAFRGYQWPNLRYSDHGFRVMVEVVAKEQVGQPRATPVVPSTAGGPSAPAPAVAPFEAQKAKQHQESWANHLKTPVEETNCIGMKLALIPPGEFDMGSTPEEIAWALEEGQSTTPTDKNYLSLVLTEAPRHRVKITKPFYVAVCPVTQGEYEKVMGVNPSAISEKQMDASAFEPSLQEFEVTYRQAFAKKVAGKDTSHHPVEAVNWD